MDGLGSPSYLQGHLDQCGECRELARKDKAVDDVLGRAMRQVTVPTGMASRILDRLEHARRPSPWTWLSIAAAVLLTAGLSLTWYLQPLPYLDGGAVFLAAHHGTSAEIVTNWLAAQGCAVDAPQVIDYAYLDSFRMASVQGRRVPELVFVNQAHGTISVAHVYIISRREFRWDDAELIQAVSAGSRGVDLIDAKQGDFWFLVIYSLGSRESFPRQPST